LFLQFCVNFYFCVFLLVLSFPFLPPFFFHLSDFYISSVLSL
jgi:hypothetical protein